MHPATSFSGQPPSHSAGCPCGQGCIPRERGGGVGRTPSSYGPPYPGYFGTGTLLTLTLTLTVKKKILLRQRRGSNFCLKQWKGRKRGGGSSYGCQPF